MSDRHRANYALVDFKEHLGMAPDRLDVPWAEFVGEQSSEGQFTVPVANPIDAYLECQVYDVGVYDHEIRVNGSALAGFDLPPAEGWQYWMNPLVETGLQEGENTIRFTRAPDSADEFVVGTVTVHWREPSETDST